MEEKFLIILSKFCLNYYVQVSHLISKLLYLLFQWMASSPAKSPKPHIQELLWLPCAPHPIYNSSLSNSLRAFKSILIPTTPITTLTVTSHQNLIPWGLGGLVCSVPRTSVWHIVDAHLSFLMNEWSSPPPENPYPFLEALLNTTTPDLPKLQLHSQHMLA